MGVKGIRKPSIQDKYSVITLYQMVFLFDKHGRYINVWHKDNVTRCKPGTLDINEGKRKYE